MNIIGNPIFLGGSGGGGGELNLNQPLIHVTAPKGATVNFSTGGTVVKSISPSDAFINSTEGTAEYYYSASNGSWTVTATNGSVSVFDTISITENREYDLELFYGHWIHRAGVGLMNSHTVAWSSGATDTVSNVREISTTQTGNFVCLAISPAISLTGYTTCHFEYVKALEGNMASSYSAAKTGRFGFGSNATTGAYNSDQKLITTVCPSITTTWTAASIDLSEITSTGYFKFMNWNNGKMGIRNLYLV